MAALTAVGGAVLQIASFGPFVAVTVPLLGLALLFLSHRGELRLQQDDLFGDLWVQDPAQRSEDDEQDEPDEELEATAD